MDNNRNFYISAYIAFGFYFLIIFLFFLYLSVNNIKKFNSFSKDTALQLDIVLEDKKIKPKKQKNIKHLKVQTARKNNKISKKIVKKSASVSAKQRSDLKSLFAKVKTKSSVVKKKIVSNVKKSSIASRFKSKFEKQSQNNNNALSKLIDNIKLEAIKRKTGDTNNEHDEYISKIYEILYNRWHPLLIIDGLSTKVIITIHSNGEFSYRIVQLSGDRSFDNQLVLFLEKQTTLPFPIPKKSKVNIEVIFTAKG